MVPHMLATLITMFLALTACFANATAATNTAGPLIRLREGLRAHQLIPRQTLSLSASISAGGNSGNNVSVDEFPAQCREECSPAVDGLNKCLSAFCLCTPAVDNSLQYCLNCTVNAVPTSDDIQKAQNIANLYNGVCTGFGLASLSISIPPGVTITGTAESTDSSIVNIQTATSPGSGPMTTVTGPASTAQGGASSTRTANQASGPLHSGIVGFPAMGFIVIMLCTDFRT